jgi:hypothetical protein
MENIKMQKEIRKMESAIDFMRLNINGWAVELFVESYMRVITMLDLPKEREELVFEYKGCIVSIKRSEPKDSAIQLKTDGKTLDLGAQ